MGNKVKIYINEAENDMYLVAGDKFIVAFISKYTAYNTSYKEIQEAFHGHLLDYTYPDETLSLEEKIAQGVVTEISLVDL